MLDYRVRKGRCRYNRKTMVTYNRLLPLGLLASLAGAGYATEPPFPAEPGFGPQIAVRLIADELQNSKPKEAEPEEPVVSEPPEIDLEVEGGGSAGLPEEDAGPVPENDGLEDLDGLLVPKDKNPDGLDIRIGTQKEREPPEQAPADEPSQASIPSESPGSEGEKSAEPSAGKTQTHEPGGAEETGRDPDLAGQKSTEEKYDAVITRAERLLNQVDRILLDAQTQARQGQDAEDSAGSGNSPRTDGGAEQEAEAEPEEDERPGVAEGQVPGNVPTGKTRTSRGYDREEDIVTRQVCELAQKEEDPEVRKNLEEKCASLQKE